MKLDLSSGEVVDVFDIGSGGDFQFSSTWKKTYEAIEQSLQEFGDAEEKERILNKIASVINVLVRYGGTYEDIVVETAEMHIFAKETGLDLNVFKKSHGKYVVEGIKRLSLPLNNRENQKLVFEDNDLLYLGKIKISECIVDLMTDSVSNELLFEIDEIIKNYSNNSHKGLIKILTLERNKRV